MRAAVFLLLLVPICWAKPFHQVGFLDFMLEDESSGDGIPLPPVGPICPFGCQCYLRVVQCSDLGLTAVPNDIPADTTLLDLQNNKITEIKENDFKNIKNLHSLILVNNKIGSVHPKAFAPLGKLERLYLSKNRLKELPVNMPSSLQELRAHENEITKIKKTALDGLKSMIVIELGTNPLKNSGIENGAFQGMRRLSYIRISDTNITAIPQGLPSSLSELHLDSNKISRVDADSLKGLKNLAKLGLSFNSINAVDNGSLDNVPHLRELHLDTNELVSVPPGLPDHKYIQVIYLHNNKIDAVKIDDFCPPGYNTKKAMYSGISLFSNPVPYWKIEPATFRCVYDRTAIQLGNYK
ncbi:decorin [Latimeria chalumnae]|nr:PREDICTED: decorin [Latimeria chalumnae]XP_006004205.1 PREDICTED: decorin [Latimeria chalumnae]|eukprot:XP_006004204.1 PREDICTED: decorin [Latimeria chalumnae]